MFSIDDINDMLDDIATELPDEVFRELNGGVSLLPDVRRSNADPGGRLYTLGEYRRDQMGRYIVIYYGSIMRVHGHASDEEMREHLRDVLFHELTHHIESMAGERDLEIEDERFMDDYFRNKKKE